MDTKRKCGITASDIDAMTGEELLELAKAQGQYVGQRMPTQEHDGPCHAANLFTYCLDNKRYWMNGLSFLTFPVPYNSEFILPRVVK